MTTLVHPLDRAWNLRQLPPAGGGWSVVDLPHNPFLADLDGRHHWFGECEYQRSIALPPGAPVGRIALQVGAAMHSAVVLLDGAEVGCHTGGYLPFEVDLTAALRDGRPHQLTLRLDNRDQPDVPPGKPYADLDFCWYGGLYRDVALRCCPAAHFASQIDGGIFVRTLAADAAGATIRVRIAARNDGSAAQTLQGSIRLLRGPDVVAEGRTVGREVAAGSAATFEADLVVVQPRLWQPDDPALYQAEVALQAADGTGVDARTVRFGIRRIAFSRAGGLVLNGRRRRFRGTNRHQDYPSVGYAVPRAAQYRDARRIKEAGFDYVRLSHYPQSPDFLDACDELGLLVMNCLPGWQFIGGEEFREACYRNARELVRRDRNHPCVVLWELSLNETDMDEAFMARLHGIGHDEFPGDQMFTCGWIDRYDVFTHSRQHGQIHRWRNGDKALVIAECADWEFFAATHGFDQKSGAGVFDRWSTARQFRGDGERGLRQQAFNHLTALNDTLSSPAVLEGQWAMFDYPRGYDPVRAAVGVMDFYRLPKFSYHFYRSQRDPSEAGAGWATGPVVFIASHWLPSSDLRVLVFSNCEEVELRLGGVLVGRQHPARTALTQHLPHPPFVFDLPRFAPGTLEAAAFIGGRRQASHSVATPGPAAGLALAVDDLAVVAATGEPDLLCVHARVVDAPGTLCCEATAPVSFVLEGRADLLGGPTVDAEAGIASLVVRVPAGSSGFLLGARTQVAGRGFAATLEWRRPVSVAAAAPTRGEFAPAD